jgi:hypothetical protein
LIGRSGVSDKRLERFEPRASQGGKRMRWYKARDRGKDGGEFVKIESNSYGPLRGALPREAARQGVQYINMDVS